MGFGNGMETKSQNRLSDLDIRIFTRFVVTSTYLQFGIICDILWYQRFLKVCFFTDYSIYVASQCIGTWMIFGLCHMISPPAGTLENDWLNPLDLIINIKDAIPPGLKRFSNCWFESCCSSDTAFLWCDPHTESLCLKPLRGVPLWQKMVLSVNLPQS